MENNVLQTNSISSYLMSTFPEANVNDNNFLSYTNFKDEYYALKYGVGIRNLTNRVKLKLSGNDTLDFLHRISTNSVSGLTDYEKANTLFTNDRGRIIDRTTLLKLSNYCMLIGSPDPELKLQKWVERFIIMEDITVEDVSSQYMILEILGPQANSFLTLICGNAIDDLTYTKVVMEELEETSFFLIRQKEIDGNEKYWLISYAENGPELIESLLKNKSAFDLRFIGRDAYNTFRIENGIPCFPNEINDNFNPHELNLLSEVDFEKGCYIGQEVIARLATYDKVQRRLATVEFDHDDGLILPASLLNDQTGVGALTSFASLDDSKKIGLGIIRQDSSEPGKELMTENKVNNSFIVKIVNIPKNK